MHHVLQASIYQILSFEVLDNPTGFLASRILIAQANQIFMVNVVVDFVLQRIYTRFLLGVKDGIGIRTII